MPTTFRRAFVAIGLAAIAGVASTPAPAVAASVSIWSSAATPQGVDSDSGAIEIGVRFRSDTNGVITGLRFYKYSSNAGAHVGNLWTNTGTLLATATFVGETGSGWQQVTFATPVSIAANTTYVASYHTNVGHYGASSGYFASGVDNAPLHALQDGVGGSNGVYRYGKTSGFPNQTYHSTNYWVDVVFAASVGGGDTTPPTVNGVTPAIAATGVSTTSVVTATFSEMMNSTTLNATTVELRDSAGNVVPASVLPGGETPTTTLIPTAPLAFGTTYTATVKGGSSGVKDLAGNALVANYSWSFTTGGTAPTPPPTSCPCTIWNAATTTASGPDTDASAVEIGVRFRSDTSGFISGLRFYKYSTNSGTHVGSLWTNTGTKLATATFTSETSSGWQQVSFTSPVAITANTTYVASYHTNAGHYAANDGYFVSGFDNAPLHALQDGVDGSSGVYRYGASSVFPDQTYRSANYWVDVVFATGVTGDTTAPTITTVTPAAGATGVNTTSVVTATFSEMMSFTAVNPTTFELRDSAGNLVPAWVIAGGETPTSTLTPTSALAYATKYTVTVKGGASGVKDEAGNPMAADYSWSFTTAAGTPPPPPPTTCPCTIWNAASTAAAGPDSDASPVELGVRFRSDTNGFITGVRFYKFSTNTGTHIGNLWTNTGTQLATATFTSESGSGWQQVTFATPVAITANTTYVASYHTNAGHYAANTDYFVAGFDNVPLHALRDGVDGASGVYRYGGTSGFPNQTYGSANYWVDVVFTQNLGADTTPPTVASTSPVSNASAVATNAVVTATFSESLNPATIDGTTVELRGPSGALVAATVTYSIVNGTAILQPASPLLSGTTYTATVKGGAVDPRAKDVAGNALAANYSWSFTTAAAPAPLACPCTVWSASASPAVADTDPSAVELGVRFRSDVAGYITGLRYYKASANGGIHVGNLWSNSGVLLARATFGGESAAGWQQVTLTPPVAIAANTTYVVSYHTNTGHYGVNSNYFASGFDNAPLHALRDGLDGPNGVYAYGGNSSFPDQTYQSANYWVDVVFNTTPGSDTTAPTVNSVTPSAGATAVDVTRVITATFSEMMATSTFNTSTFELRDGGGRDRSGIGARRRRNADRHAHAGVAARLRHHLYGDRQKSRDRSGRQRDDR